MHTLNLGILAHVDAGKTSLTERLLHSAGVIDEIGSVDDGNTQTDSLALERQRGITIKSAVVSFAIDDLTVNLIDTPGHPDFIAEVERVLSVLDGAVLVISAVEAVQAQTRVLMRTLMRLGIPTLLFVNKIDRSGAGYERILRAIIEKLTPAVVAMQSVRDIGTRHASAHPYGAELSPALLDLLAERDDALLAAYVRDESTVSADRLREALAEQTRTAAVHPVFFGSAITGAGVDDLIEGIRHLLPTRDREPEPDGPFAGTVFKVERGPAGEKIAYVRVFSGTVRVRDRLPFGTREGKVTGLRVFDRGLAQPRTYAAPGQIAKVTGLGDVRIGDNLGVTVGSPSQRQHFAPPTLETVVLATDPAQKGSLHAALTQLAEQDPLINLRQDARRQEISVSLYGEVQKEVIQTTLADDFGIDVTFRDTTTICIERPAGTGHAVEIINHNGNPFLATIGLRVEPGAWDTGVRFALDVELGSLPLAFVKAVDETVAQTLREGIHGWQVADCLVTLTQSGYWARQSHAHAVFDKSMSSTAGDFRSLTPLVLMSALREAGTMVYEPMHRFRVDAPADTFTTILAALARLRAIPLAPATRGSTCVIDGAIPAAQVHELSQLLPGLTRGEGVLESAFDRYQPIRGAVPSRQRSDHNPLDRKEYLLHVVRRV